MQGKTQVTLQILKDKFEVEHMTNRFEQLSWDAIDMEWDKDRPNLNTDISGIDILPFADEHDLTFFDGNMYDSARKYINNTKSKFIICNYGIMCDLSWEFPNKVLISSMYDNPKHLFMLIVSEFFL